ncbi:hypothetical protein IAU59_002657 [Kwoniella sp. CBS 9459]
MASPLKTYLGRSIDLLRRSTAKVVKMDATPQATPTTIFTFDSSLSGPEHPIDDVSHFGLGSDSEVGGLSTCNLALIPSAASGSRSTGTPAAAVSSSTASSAENIDGSGSDLGSGVPYSHMAFYGYMSTKVPPTQTGKIRTGYAGFRNTSRPTLFGQDTWDLELYTHLKVVLGYRGWEGWRNRWVLNIGIDGRPRSDVFQHRLEIPPSASSTSSKLPLDPLATSSPPIEFTTLYLPLSSFVLIKKGLIAASPIPLPRSDIRTVGFALLGRDRGDDGPLEATASSAGAGLTSAGEGYTPGQGLKSLGMRLGGWGKTTAEEAKDDPELRALLEEDARASATSNGPSVVGEGVEPGLARSEVSSLPRPPRPSSANTSGYHRVGSAAGSGVRGAGAGATQGTPATATSTTASSAPTTSVLGDEREGYYELCIKSVEAVKWDPENENELEV